MNCENYSDLIDDLVEGELDEQNAEQTNLHLFACAECASQFELLKQEKELYAHYLFEIEPPSDLLMKFQNKLETEKQQTILATKPFFGVSQWATKTFGFLSLNPALTTVVLLILAAVGFSFLNSLKSEPNSESKNVAQTGLERFQLMLPSIRESVFTPSNSKKDEIADNKNVAESGKNKSSNNPKPVAIKQTVVKEKINTKRTKEVSSEADQLAKEERMQILQIKALETETAKQMEKVELLLRSFRNARFVEGSERYDILYEKQQARKLLQNNIELRQRAESYGTLFTEEMLSKVEPYLLDIANLDSNPSSDQVLEIKERVRSQNIIASLQSF